MKKSDRFSRRSRCARARVPLSEALEPRVLLAASLTKDVNEQPWSALAVPNPVRVGDNLYFVTAHADTGRELWKTDGTPAGTSLVRDIYPGPVGSAPERLTAVGGVLYFIADNGVHGRSPWKSDGTVDGTVLVDDVIPGPQGLLAYRVGAAGDKVVFATHGTNAASATDAAVWASDGTPAGTGVVNTQISHPATYGQPESEPIHLGSTFYGVTAGNTFYFLGQTPSAGTELWKSDGTAAGTMMVKDINPGVPGSGPTRFGSAGGRAYFLAVGGAGRTGVWTTDGTAAGTTLLLDQSAMAGPSYTPLAEFNGLFYFSAFDPATSSPALWRTDGTAAGTEVIFLGPQGIGPAAVAGGSLLFAVGRELWKSDGTPEGTVPIKVFAAGDDYSFPRQFVGAGGNVVFVAGEAAGESDVWASDGTAAGTRRIADVQTGFGIGNTPTNLVAAPGGRVVYLAHSPAGRAFQSADPSAPAGGAQVLTDNHSNTGSAPTPAVPVRGDGTRPTVVYAAHTGTDAGVEVFVSDGTPGGATVVREIPFHDNPGDVTILAIPNGRALVMRPTGRWLFGTDGTAAGTVDFAESRPVFHPTAHRGLLYFAAENRTALWRTDGTPEGTVRIKTFGQSMVVQQMASDGERLYLGMSAGTTGRPSLWTSDGTDAGTRHVVNLTGAEIVKMGAAAPGLMFYELRLSFTTPGNLELWRTDGTAAGTFRVKAQGGQASDFTAFRGQLFFEYHDFNGPELWKSDGTAAGTRAVTSFPPGGVDLGIFGLAVAGDVLYFARTQGLYRSDGTTAGTTLVPSATGQVYAPTMDSRANKVTAAGNTVFFSATSGGDELPAGDELWQTDPSGTRVFRVADIAPGRNDSLPSNFVAVGDTLFFAADDGDHGQEMWAARGEPPAVVAGRHLFYNNSAFDPATGPSPSTADRKGLAVDKFAMLPGGESTVGNVSNYSKGINGLFVDFLGAPRAPLTASDFEFKVGSAGDPAGWPAAPAPLAVARLPEWLGNGAARYAITWADGAIRNPWLRVTVRANAATGLAAEDVFYFGNLVGETGDAPGRPSVTARDLALVRGSAGGAPVSSTNRYDVNRDGRVNATDALLVRANLTRSLAPVTGPVLGAALGDFPPKREDRRYSPATRPLWE